MKRVTHEPAYVLHHYDWSESSLILEVFTRHHGRVALVAKGAKRPSSNFRPVLLPLQPLQLSYSGGAEIGTLKNAEWGGGHVMPKGEGLLSGYYLNELLLRLLPREDAHHALFDAYAATVALLAGAGNTSGDTLQATLRAFELVLLREAGVLPALHQTLSHQPLVPAQTYTLTPEAGLRLVDATTASSADAPSHWHAATLHGAQWLALHQAMQQTAPLHALVHLCLTQRPVALALRKQLRALLLYHCGADMLRTRQLMMELHQL